MACLDVCIFTGLSCVSGCVSYGCVSDGCGQMFTTALWCLELYKNRYNPGGVFKCNKLSGLSRVHFYSL
jgi:hypothetical protein